MKQLTIRELDAQLEQHLRRVARGRGISLNRAAILLMRRGAGLASPDCTSRNVGSALDEFVGLWSRDQEDELLKAVKDLRAWPPS